MSWNAARARRWPALTDEQYVERYKSKCVVEPSGCWTWQGWVALRKGSDDPAKGYPESTCRGRKVRVNRWMLEHKLGRPLTAEEFACHRCDNTRCINPDHLYAGTHQQNMDDMNARGRNGYKARQVCVNGHPFTPDNTEIRPSRGKPGAGRSCKWCSRIRQRMKAGWTREEAELTPIIPPGAKTARRQFDHRRSSPSE